MFKVGRRLSIPGARSGQLLLAVGMFLCCTCLAAVQAPGQRVYQWTDENGVVHFADSPPRKGTRFEVRDMPRATAPASVVPAAARGAPAADEKERAAPAHVVIKNRQSAAVGESVREFRGKVENEGGSQARDVYVSIKVVETNQGAECLREEIDVDPPTLLPGASGSFSAEFDNPCFFGPTTADLRAEWR